MCETANTVKILMPTRISYVPKDEKEKKHVDALESLLAEKRRGDWQLVGEILNISAGLAEKRFLRVYQKNHFETVEALQKVITNRKNLLIQ